jgi:hypothetical protein
MQQMAQESVSQVIYVGEVNVLWRRLCELGHAKQFAVLFGFCGPNTPSLPPSIHCQLIEVCDGGIITAQYVGRLCRVFESGPTDIHDDGRSYRL